jgi:hypothetical protein
MYLYAEAVEYRIFVSICCNLSSNNTCQVRRAIFWLARPFRAELKLLIIGTLVVIQQLDFMKNKDIGLNKDQMLLVHMNREANRKFETLKAEIGKSRCLRRPRLKWGLGTALGRIGSSLCFRLASLIINFIRFATK